MTAKEKAKQLVDKFTVVGLQQRNEGYQCALIAVDEILDNNLWFNDEINNNYWFEVKQEIKKL